MESITLRYITDTPTEETLTIKDVAFRWSDVYWPEKKSIGGVTATQQRGVESYLELTFEHDESVLGVANTIHNTLSNGGTVQYVTDGGVLPMYPIEARVEKNYIGQIIRKPSKLILVGNIQDERTFIITGVLCGAMDVYCGSTNILCGA